MFFGLKMIIFYKRPVYKPLTIPANHSRVCCCEYLCFPSVRVFLPFG